MKVIQIDILKIILMIVISTMIVIIILVIVIVILQFVKLVSMGAQVSLVLEVKCLKFDQET